MDTTDLTNRINEENEQEEFDEQKRIDEEDRGLDSLNRDKNYSCGANANLTDEQKYNFRQQNIKAIYSIMYSLGLDGKTEKVRNKLDKLSMFFGNVGGVSNISDDELCAISQMLQHLKNINYKFKF